MGVGPRERAADAYMRALSDRDRQRGMAVAVREAEANRSSARGGSPEDQGWGPGPGQAVWRRGPSWENAAFPDYMPCT